MANAHALKARAPRLLGNHSGKRGRWYRECWDALDAELGSFTGLLRLEAAHVAVAWTQFRAATVALEAVKDKRATGRGRRPGDRQIERFARRQGLADASYAQALDRLREYAAATGARTPKSGADLVALRRATRTPWRHALHHRVRDG